MKDNQGKELPQIGGGSLLPCAPDVCQECALDHDPEYSHNADSLYYQYKFYAEHGRWPTWKDAMEHSPEHLKTFWIEELKKAGKWEESEDANQV